MWCQPGDSARTGRVNTPSQRPGKTFRWAVHTKMQLFWILSADVRAREWVIDLDWIQLKQPDSLIYPVRLRRARADKRFETPQFYLSNVREIKWFPRDFTECLHSISIRNRCQTQQLPKSGASVVWKVRVESLPKRQGKTTKRFKNSVLVSEKDNHGK